MEEQLTSSPLPQEAEIVDTTLDFFDALKQVLNNQQITRLEWGSKDIYGLMQDGELRIHLTDKGMQQWIISDGDMRATDWVTI